MINQKQRWIGWLLILTFAFLLSGCGGGTAAPEPQAPAETAGPETPAETGEPEQNAEEPAEAAERGDPFAGLDLTDLDAERISEIQESVRTLQWVKEAMENGEVVGYLILVTPTSYGGPMEVVTAIDTNGTILQVDIGEHEDSEGIGTQVENPLYLNRYNGVDSASGISGVDSIAGATMSSGGVKDGVSRAYTIYENFLSQ